MMLPNRGEGICGAGDAVGCVSISDQSSVTNSYIGFRLLNHLSIKSNALVARRTQIFGNVARLFSSYEARFDPDDPEPFKRGINSIQLFHDGKRWWIINMLWDNERDDNPLPAKYLIKE